MRRILLLPLLMISTIGLAQDPVKVDPANYRVLFENEHMHVLEHRDKPGDKAPMYSHPAHMTYVTGSGKVRDTLPDGESSIDEIAGSEFACLPPTTHAGAEHRRDRNTDRRQGSLFSATIQPSFTEVKAP